jgi:hypothetical protein
MSQICSHTLCKSCEAFLRQERRSENDILHDSLSGFQAAVSLGCRICTDLWALFDRDRDIDSSLNLDFNDMTFGVRWRTFLKSSSRPYVQLSISYGGICHHYTLEFSDYLGKAIFTYLGFVF